MYPSLLIQEATLWVFLRLAGKLPAEVTLKFTCSLPAGVQEEVASLCGSGVLCSLLASMVCGGSEQPLTRGSSSLQRFSWRCYWNFPENYWLEHLETCQETTWDAGGTGWEVAYGGAAATCWDVSITGYLCDADCHKKHKRTKHIRTGRRSSFLLHCSLQQPLLRKFNASCWQRKDIGSSSHITKQDSEG